MGTLIEDIYAARRMGQDAQDGSRVDAAQVGQAFAETVADLQGARARGRFFETRGKALGDLLADRSHSADRVLDTEHLQGLLWQPPRHLVEGHPELDFIYLARELTPTSSVSRNKRVWLTPEERRHLSLDALLMNADDRTPVAAEIKVGSGQNAEYALIQALAGAAQLATDSQRRRLHDEFREYLGARAPANLDVYVITARAPQRGIRPQLAARAHDLARELQQQGLLSPWVRRIRFLEAHLAEGQLSLRVADNP